MILNPERVNILLAKLRELPVVPVPRRIFLGPIAFTAFSANFNIKADDLEFEAGNLQFFSSSLLLDNEVLSIDPAVRKIFTPKVKPSARLDGTIKLPGDRI